MAVLQLRDIEKMKRWREYQVNRTWQNLEKMGVFYDGRVRLGPFEGIRDAWKNEPAFVVGCGRSLRGIDLKTLDGLHTIGINHIIEDYDGLEWFTFLDNRFLQTTKYDMEKFQGRIFASNKTVIFGNRITRFECLSRDEKPTLDPAHGLFNSHLTGLVAIHLAIISGANPIYLLGCGDTSDSSAAAYHYKDSYTGEQKKEDKRAKYRGAWGYAKDFEPWADRIINVNPDAPDIPFFKKITQDEFKALDFSAHKKKRSAPIEVNYDVHPTICHVISMKNMDEMGEISRTVFSKTIGNHIFASVNNDNFPRADIYLLECFINGHERYVNFQKPPGSKVISIIHSAGRCMPAACSDRVVVLTNSWKERIHTHPYSMRVIGGCLDVERYANFKPDYSKAVFGRITRTSNGKIHSRWNEIVKTVLQEIPTSEYRMISNNPEVVGLVNHERAVYDRSIVISDVDKKADALCKMSVYVHAGGGFIETFSLGLLEAMACGLPCIVLRPQPAMEEVLGGAGIMVDTMDELKRHLVALLKSPAKRELIGRKCRERAKEFSTKKMVRAYNRLFAEVLAE